MAIGDPVTVEGQQCRLWLYRPDGELLERLEWLTDVLGSFDGAEQRIQLRGVPRRRFEFGHLLVGRDRRTAENLLHKWQGRPWAVPVWMDAQALAAPLAGGATSVPVDTVTRDFVAGGHAVIATDPQTYEVVAIDTVDAASLTLAAPTAAAWPAGAEVLPLRAARMPPDGMRQRFTGNGLVARLAFDCTGSNDWPAATGEASYRGHPVIDQPPNWTEDVPHGWLSKLASLDPSVAQPAWDEEGSGQVTMQTHRWLLDGRDEIDAFRRWAYARKGCLGAFWLPTFATDLQVVAPIAAAATTIDVEHAGYTAAVNAGMGRRDLRILTRAGTYWRRVTGSVVLGSTTERLAIDSALGADVGAGDVLAVSFMDLVRNEADAIELSWWAWNAVEVRISTRGSRNDL
ncbi:MAG TPA: hypothetical protein VNV16_14910 [Methylibium sp.]|nr:hypothetical protein [Methylibium sp.]